MLVCAVGFIDRQVLNLLVDSIKGDLLLSDVQVSFLQGAAFSIAFLALTPIFGRAVDLFGRRPILVGGLLWTDGGLRNGAQFPGIAEGARWLVFNRAWRSVT